MKVMNTSKSPKRARISTGNADAWGASAVTSSPGGDDNNPPPGESPHNGSPSSRQVNNNILLFNWTRERAEPAGQVEIRDWAVSHCGHAGSPLILEVRTFLGFSISSKQGWNERGVPSLHEHVNPLPSPETHSPPVPAGREVRPTLCIHDWSMCP